MVAILRKSRAISLTYTNKRGVLVLGALALVLTIYFVCFEKEVTIKIYNKLKFNNHNKALFYRPRLTKLSKKLWSANKLYTDHMYVISMQDKIKRRGRVQSVFDTLGLDVEYVRAIDFKAQRKSLNVSQEQIDKLETLKDVGCWLTMAQIWKDMLSKGYERVFIFEDDMDPPLDIHAHIRKGLSVIESQKDFFTDYLNKSRKHNDWQIYHVGHVSIKEYKNPPVDKSYTRTRRAFGPLALHAYILTRNGAKEFVERYGEKIDKEIDQIIAHSEYHHTIYGYSTEPTIITHRADFERPWLKGHSLYGGPPKSTIDHIKKYIGFYSEKEIVEMGL
ncbi:hypothetical protein H4219_003999 [Mycoemilia scoparia]|uniref:Glycosyl transferase family 25 domain-containing protein n=1 Tax=Mycoemilia scoparia TaxID=417184 RepID=A0A9W7ZZP8_9FUNG|nr:hypothetical protein H4219_003999 [Mycoemilia scoparia]